MTHGVRYGKKLGIKQPFLYQMVSIVIDNMKDFYSYLVDKQAIIEKIIKTEEENFLKTLATGEKKLNDIMSNSKEKVISGASAFLLYDTFGFPIELTQEAASDNGFIVDIVGFNEELEKQKNRARNARSNEQSMNIQNEEYLNFKRKSEFVGYTTLPDDWELLATLPEGFRPYGDNWRMCDDSESGSAVATCRVSANGELRYRASAQSQHLSLFGHIYITYIAVN